MTASSPPASWYRLSWCRRLRATQPSPLRLIQLPILAAPLSATFLFSLGGSDRFGTASVFSASMVPAIGHDHAVHEWQGEPVLCGVGTSPRWGTPTGPRTV